MKGLKELFDFSEYSWQEVFAKGFVIGLVILMWYVLCWVVL